MSLHERLNADLKTAMREKDDVARDTLRMLLAGAKNRRIELGRELDEGDLLGVLEKAVKSREDSAEQYVKAGRSELAEKERAEIAVIQRYLPKRLSAEETEAVVKTVIDEVGAQAKSDLGRVMKAVLGKHKGQVDGKTVSQIAGRLLS